ncbi:MAG: hypothetical protein NVS9B4_25210 [Candidatus Acidiferrum sp.]
MSIRAAKVLPQLPNKNFRPARVLDFVLGALFFAGCGAPGDPTPPTPPVPVAIADLLAQQDGDTVRLTFTMPAKTVNGDHLATPPAIEILRGNLAPDGSPDSRSFRVIDTIPGSLVAKYQIGSHVKFSDKLAPVKGAQDASGASPSSGEILAYRIRTRASLKRASADSNTAIVHPFPVAERISGIHAVVTENGIDLTWSAPSHTSAGDPLGNISTYRIYRGESQKPARTPDPKEDSKDSSQENSAVPMPLLAESSTNSYRDTQFVLGKTYVYVIRSVTNAGGNLVESEESDPALVAALDTFPPAAPQGLVAAVLPGQTPGALVVDLSWSLSMESDLVGYRVYRSEDQATLGNILNTDPLPTPAFRDTSVQPGHHYWYTITAVDRTGNESAPSPALAVEVAQPIS